ncbi:hypothetical protein B0T17DRAFT_588674 [Bombardia bombarda]|uniref:Alpha-ketoglutarate-dependent dioxygenase AlkB-like domain-containing protein n=1 Tax=Bombardia bombarda TaxID=252184 RepID=A0AA40C8X9_9PEZI|nr:hypothetical protein B0T17DRAFT_588674 [Bombardia bombarda]
MTTQTDLDPLGAATAASPLMSPLSPPPAWFNNDDLECPAGQELPLDSPPISPLTPPPAWFNDDDTKCPSFKRSFEWLAEDGDDTPLKRVCLEDDKLTEEHSDIPNEPQTPVSNESEIPPCSILTIDIGKPEVWANLRGGLCEALPYFRAYKGSLHSRNREAAGFLIDKEASVRDFFGSQVIISSAGGGRVRVAETNKMVRLEDATDDAMNIKAIRKAHENRALIAVVADVWGEMQITLAGHNPVRVWRIRLEKANLYKPSWWATEDGQQPTASAGEKPCVPFKHCDDCNIESKEIFSTGWTCLNHKCNSFFKFPPETGEIDVNELAYTEAFFNKRHPFTGPLPLLKPEIPSSTGLHGTEKVLRRGFVCPDCGCCSRQIFWNRLVCEHCAFTVKATMLPYPKDALENETAMFDLRMERRRKQNRAKKGSVSQIEEVKEEKVDVTELATRINRSCVQLTQDLALGQYKVRQYYLPDPEGNIIGSFTLFVSNSNINSSENGPDDIFRQLETTDIGLKRNPVAIVGHKLEGLTRHFQQNFGARYKFGVSVQSKGFDEAPDVVLRALHRLVWAGKGAIAATTEMLADGEKKLGPTVAALSLGSPSTMKFRPKIKSGFGDSLPKNTSGSYYKDVLEVPFKHGDMMVMHGQAIHRVYEHAVEPMGMRRFSLTCRYIDPDKMKTQADRDDAAAKGAFPEHSTSFAYNGD